MIGIHWDCDGTIMDTERLYAYAWQTHLKAFGLSIPEDEIKQLEKYEKKKSKASKLISSRRKNTVVITVILLCFFAPLAWLLGTFLADLYR